MIQRIQLTILLKEESILVKLFKETKSTSLYPFMFTNHLSIRMMERGIEKMSLLKTRKF
jgi:hypothetical protein